MSWRTEQILQMLILTGVPGLLAIYLGVRRVVRNLKGPDVAGTFPGTVKSVRPGGPDDSWVIRIEYVEAGGKPGVHIWTGAFGDPPAAGSTVYLRRYGAGVQVVRSTNELMHGIYAILLGIVILIGPALMAAFSPRK
jgi:hypothetical protein